MDAMDHETLASELSDEDLEGINGGVLTESRKQYIKKVLRHAKRIEDADLDSMLDMLKNNPEESAYVRSVWDQV